MRGSEVPTAPWGRGLGFVPYLLTAGRVLLWRTISTAENPTLWGFFFFFLIIELIPIHSLKNKIPKCVLQEVDLHRPEISEGDGTAFPGEVGPGSRAGDLSLYSPLCVFQPRGRIIIYSGNKTCLSEPAPLHSLDPSSISL